MNENPAGTPNPLNPNPLDANPAEPMQPSDGMQNTPAQESARPFGGRPRMSMRATQPMSRPSMGNPRPINVVEQSSPAQSPVAQSGDGDLNTLVESLDPTGRQMEQAPVFVEKPKKKKTGLIVTLIICIALLIGGGVVAAIFLLGNSGDPVSMALDKIASGKAPTNVAVAGSMELTTGDEYSPIESIRLDIDSRVKQNPSASSAVATLTLDMRDMDDVSLEFDEIYAEGGDIYLKINGATQIVESLSMLMGPSNYNTPREINDMSEESMIEPINLDTTNCNIEGTNCVEAYTEPLLSDDTMASVFSIVEMIDGQWLRISADELSAITESFTGSMNSSQSSEGAECIVDLLNDSTVNVSGLYGKYPFIVSSSEKSTIQKKKDPIYRVDIDTDNFASFTDSMMNSFGTNRVTECLSTVGISDVNTADIKQIASELPPFYLEINGSHDITRFFTQMASDGYNFIVDLSFDYPSELVIDEPAEYMNLTTLVQTILMNFNSSTEDASMEYDEIAPVEESL